MMADSANAPRMDDRFVIAAALDRIIYDDPDTFSAEDARLLRSLVPRTRPSRLGLGFRSTTRGPSAGGHAAGVGDVQLDGENRTVEKSIGIGPVWRCGQYKVSHQDRTIEVWQVMSDELAETPKGARLEFGIAGEPLSLLFFQPRDVELRIPFTELRIGVRLGGWGPWKRPV